MESLVDTLIQSNSVKVHPTVPEDFLDYDTLLNHLFQSLMGKVKKNHIVLCSDDGLELILRQSNLVEHEETDHKLQKKTWNFSSQAELAQY